MWSISFPLPLRTCCITQRLANHIWIIAMNRRIVIDYDNRYAMASQALIVAMAFFRKFNIPINVLNMIVGKILSRLCAIAAPGCGVQNNFIIPRYIDQRWRWIKPMDNLIAILKRTTRYYD